MRRKSKKLSLHRETLVNLEPEGLQGVQGLTAVHICGTRTCMPPHSGCEWSGQGTACFTFAATCTTNLC